MAGTGREGAGSDLLGYLQSLDHDTLINLLVEAARRYPALSRQLRLAAASADPDNPVTEAVENAFISEDALSRAATIRYARWAGEAVDLVEALVSANRAEEAAACATHAVDRLVSAMRRADDGAGVLAALLRRLLGTHLRAVRRSARRPEPAELAAWLAGVQLDGPARAAVSLGRYAPVLGRSGVDAYRAHVLRRFAQAPGDLRARYAREDLARHERDVDGLVEVLGGTLDSAAAYTRLARALRDIGAETEAIEWAERGLRAHPDGTAAARLRQFLVERYTAGRPPAEAVAAARAAFAATPSLSGYRALHQAAKRAGAWPAERDAAREVLRSRPDDHIRALLDDGDVAAAWRAAISAEATLAGSTWDEVARRRAARRPADAIPVLRRRIGEVLDGRDRGRGPDAVQRLVELREAHERDGTAGAFADFLRELTVTYRRRPALLAELAEAGLTA